MKYANWTERKLEYYLEKLKKGEHFSMTRYGDGEFKAMLSPNPKKKNYSGHHFYPRMVVEMMRALYKGYHQENHFVSCRRNTIRFAPDYIQNENFQWEDCDWFIKAADRGELYPLVEQLRKMKVVVIGSKELLGGGRRIFENSVAETVEVPLKDAWLAIAGDPIHVGRKIILDELLVLSDRLGDDVVYSFSASFLTKTLIVDLHEQRPNNWFLDFGSLWDPYAGFISRKEHETMDPELIKKNLGEGG